MNLLEIISFHGIDVKKLRAALLAYENDIAVPSHYEEPFSYIQAINKIDIVESFLKLLDDDRENELSKGESKA